VALASVHSLNLVTRLLWEKFEVLIIRVGALRSFPSLLLFIIIMSSYILMVTENKDTITIGLY
jgi:hypothetical protein